MSIIIFALSIASGVLIATIMALLEAKVANKSLRKRIAQLEHEQATKTL